MAGVAIYAHMFPDEFPSAVARMIECGLAPLLCLVATGAVSSHTACMHILPLVAADAFLWQLIL